MNSLIILLLVAFPLTLASISDASNEWFRLMRSRQTDTDLKRITELMDQVEVNAPASQNGEPAFLMAVDNNKLEIVRVLGGDSRVNILCTDSSGSTGLQNAISKGKFEMVKLLASLKDGALVDIKDDNGDTPLHQALRGRNLDIVKFLASIQGGKLLDIPNNNGRTPLQLAVSRDNLELIECLASLQQGNLVHIRDENGQTLLHQAIWRGKLKVVELLASLDGGSLLGVLDGEGRSALNVAVFSENLKITKFLATHQGGKLLEVTDSMGETILHTAVWNDNVELVEFLVSIGQDKLLDARDNNGNTALHLAVSNGKFEMVKILGSRQEGRLVNSADKNQSLLLSAMSTENYEIIEYLAGLQGGVLLDSRYENGATALHWAILLNKIEIVNILATVQGGRLLNIPDTDGNSPLIYAVKIAQNNDFSLIRELVRLGANLNIQDNSGYTALFQAILLNNIELIRFLCQQANISITSPIVNNVTPILHFLNEIRDQQPGALVYQSIVGDLLKSGSLTFDADLGNGMSYIKYVLTSFNQQQLSVLLESLVGKSARALPIEQLSADPAEVLSLVENLIQVANANDHVGWLCEALWTVYRVFKENGLLLKPLEDERELSQFLNFLKDLQRIPENRPSIFRRIERLQLMLTRPNFIFLHAQELSPHFVVMMLEAVPGKILSSDFQFK